MNFSITGDTVIKGSWRFALDTYTVSYEWDGTVYPSSAVLPATQTYSHGDPVTVAAGYEPVHADNGTYTFVGWDKENFSITGDTVIKGSWTFALDTQYTVTYHANYEGADPLTFEDTEHAQYAGEDYTVLENMFSVKTTPSRAGAPLRQATYSIPEPARKPSR